MTDAGPFRSPANAPIVPASALEIGVHLSRVQPRATEWGDHFSLIVTAHNPASHAVQLRLSPYGDGNLGVSFSYLLGPDTTNAIGAFDVAYDPEELYFAAGASTND